MLYQLSYFRNFRFSAGLRFRPFGGEATARRTVWAEMDSNHRSRKTADLQSAPFGHSGIRPILEFQELVSADSFRSPLAARKDVVATEPMEGFEPPTS